MPAILTARLNNIASLQVDAVQKLINDALREFDINLLDALPTVISLMSSERSAVFVATEDGQFRGVSVVTLPTSIFDKVPQVPILYNSGGSGVRKALIQATVDFIRQAGYNRFWAMNRTGKADKVWGKVMKPKGWKVSPVGSVMQFEVENG